RSGRHLPRSILFTNIHRAFDVYNLEVHRLLGLKVNAADQRGLSRVVIWLVRYNRCQQDTVFQVLQLERYRAPSIAAQSPRACALTVGVDGLVLEIAGDGQGVPRHGELS